MSDPAVRQVGVDTESLQSNLKRYRIVKTNKDLITVKPVKQSLKNTKNIY